MSRNWQYIKLVDFVKLQRGHDLTEHEREPGKVPVMGSFGITGYHNVAKMKGPGVTIGRSGASIGVVCYTHDDFWPLNTALYVTDFHGNDERFAYYFLKTLNLTNYNSGSAQPSLNRNYIYPMLIKIPPFPEQQAIVTVLSDVDALITSLDRLIAKKRDIKQATIQQLLTGKTRLSGFSDDWKEKKLGEIAEIDSDNLSNNTHPDYSFKYISLEDVDTGVLKSYSEINFRDAPSRARRKVKMNDILVSTVRPNLKSHLHITNDIPDLVCSTGFSVLRCYQTFTDPGYIYFHLFAEEVGRQIESLLTGSNYPAINGGDVRALRIPFPPLTEQQAIAAVLSDMDAEIAALEQKRDKIRALKQGMMQELLTGKTRLI